MNCVVAAEGSKLYLLVSDRHHMGDSAWSVRFAAMRRVLDHLDRLEREFPEGVRLDRKHIRRISGGFACPLEGGEKGIRSVALRRGWIPLLPILCGDVRTVLEARGRRAGL